MPKSLAFELDRDEIGGSVAGARAVHGTVALEGDALVIDYTLDRIDGFERGLARIGLEHATKILMTGGVLKSPRLVLDVDREEALREVPWATGRQCVLRFRRADGQSLRELIGDCEIVIARLRTR